MRDAKGQFVKHAAAENSLPVGSVRIRKRHGRGGVERAWVKVAEPDVWKLRAQLVWEQANGPLPRGRVIHHKDEDTLNDALSNLEMLTKAAHLDEHRAEYLPTTVPKLIAARRERRWSTKSTTKRTGAPPSFKAEDLAAALTAVAGGMSAHEASLKFGVARTTLYRRIRGAR